jgi:urease accessory protein
MVWHAKLSLDYSRRGEQTLAHFEHEGPLRILRSLYPQGPAICHNVLVHPPSGLVGGDTLDIRIRGAEGTHGLISTPGAARFYLSDGLPARQHTHVQLEDGARLEWLPMETILYSGCLAENRLTMDLQPGAELLGWDVCALGLPHSGKPFTRGHFRQHIELQGHWLERGLLDAADARLMDGATGLAGQRCLAMLYFASGSPLTRERRDAALELAREAQSAHPLAATAGATSPNPQVLVLRVLAPVVEPAMQLLRNVWAHWRAHLWNIPGETPRIWSV